jgi:hypothetical protein
MPIRQIDALDIAVTSTSREHGSETSSFPATVVMVVNGDSKGGFSKVTFSCSPVECIDARKPGAEQVPGTQNINITGDSSSSAVVSTGK